MKTMMETTTTTEQPSARDAPTERVDGDLRRAVTRGIMVDLETLGTRPGSIILSIGAVAFSSTRVGSAFEVHVDACDCEARGMRMDVSTALWWMRQTDDARHAILRPQIETDDYQFRVARPLPTALDEFESFVLDHGDPAALEVWSNGADFDLPILAAAFEAVGRRWPFRYWNHRCYRTMANLHPLRRRREPRLAHRAVDDATAQAQHLVDIFGKTLGTISS